MSTFVVAGHLFVLLLLAVYGVHRLALLYLYYAHATRTIPRPPGPLDPSRYPGVTVQLPMYNEPHVVERLLRAVSKLRYPRERLHIQILDDSTDGTQALARACAADLVARGLHVTYHHRTDRRDYKAGALHDGLAHSPHDLFAIFDADFVPPADFLERTVPHFTDPSVGMVQARWTYLNETYSLLTRLQARLLDGHFVIEHAARCLSGRFFNFKGTAGVWRRRAIVDAGGWQGDTLTEDLDLSYRAQIAGWRFVFLPNLTCPSELPVDLHALRIQQHRWTKGSIQVARKILPTIWRSALPLRVKVEAAGHLTANINYLLMVALTVLTPLSLILRHRVGWESLGAWELALCTFTLVSIGLFYIVAQVAQGRRWTARIGDVPFLVAFGIGMCVNNTRAVIEALRGSPSPFIRTAKYGIEGAGGDWGHKTDRSLARGVPLAEAGLAVYLAASLGALIALGNWGALPFIALFLAGYSSVSVVAILHARP